MAYVVTVPDQPTLPVEGSGDLFPVHRIYCVGRNYAAHAIEMGHDPDREPPFFFQKNPDNLLVGAPFPYPPASQDVHFELEMIVALSSGGTDIPVEKALDCVYGYGVGLDMTRRDLQGEAKKMGRPWEIGKAFEHSAPTSLKPASTIGHPTSGRVQLTVNGEVRQGRRSRPDDLEGAGDDQLFIRSVHLAPWRPYLQWHACGRGGHSQKAMCLKGIVEGRENSRLPWSE